MVVCIAMDEVSFSLLHIYIYIWSWMMEVKEIRLEKKERL